MGEPGVEPAGSLVDPVEAEESSIDAADVVEEEPSLGVRIVWSLMLLASSIVLLFALPVFAWQMTTLAETKTNVDGTAFDVRIVKRFGEVTVRITGPAGERRFPFPGADDQRIEGKPSIEVEDGGRRLTTRVGEHERQFEFQDDDYEPVE